WVLTSVVLVCPCHSSRFVRPSRSGSCSRTSASAIGNPNCSSHSLGTGGCTSVVCNVAGKPFAPMKCFSGTKRPERPPKVHCGGWCNLAAAAASSSAFANGDTLFNEGAGGIPARVEPKRAEFLQIKIEERKSSNAAPIKSAFSLFRSEEHTSELRH